MLGMAWKRLARRGASLLGALVLIGLVVAGSAWLILRARNAESFAIRSPQGIQEARYVRLGGVEQWVTIRGQDRRNPVLLVVHGGPGGATSAFTKEFLAWERDFTVVQWDQQGAGKTYARSGAPAKLTLDAIASDGVELARILNTRFGRKVVVLGWSWGSLVGLKLVKAEPNLFAAYVGAGLIVDRDAARRHLYNSVLTFARQRKDPETAAALANAGPPPYREREAWNTLYGAANKHVPMKGSPLDSYVEVLTHPDWGLRDARAMQQGMAWSTAHFGDENGPWGRFNIASLGTEFHVPIILIMGGSDYVTPADHARTWLEGVRAPHKRWLAIAGADHGALRTDGGAFLSLLKQEVGLLEAPSHR
jgi:pimeloyl-ACP methyl ester carboxylesterase